MASTRLPTAFDYYKVLPGQGKYFKLEFFEKGKKNKFTMEGHSTDCIMDSVYYIGSKIFAVKNLHSS